MAPHVEEYKPLSTLGDGSSGAWVALPDTYHRSNDASQEAQKAHSLVSKQPKKYREVADDLGSECERNPLVDDED